MGHGEVGAGVSLEGGPRAAQTSTATRRPRERGRAHDKTKGFTVPTGKVKWYDQEKGFGFISGDDGEDVFLHANALPQGVSTLGGGTRVEFGIVEGRRGAQALSVTVLEPAPSVAANRRERDRKPAEDMEVIIEDLIKLLDGVGAGLRRGRYPEKGQGKKIAQVMRRVADDLDV